jgi:hypothetical protein
MKKFFFFLFFGLSALFSSNTHAEESLSPAPHKGTHLIHYLRHRPLTKSYNKEHLPIIKSHRSSHTPKIDSSTSISQKSKKDKSKKKKKQKYPITLAMTAIFQNEASYLKEWIEYHHMIGVEFFLLYNNLSTDNYREILDPYIESGLVTLIDWSYDSQNQISIWNKIQCRAYKNALGRVKGKVKWLAVADIDEFFVPIQEDNLVKILERYSEVASVACNWLVFGTSYVDKIPSDKLLIETLTLRSEPNNPINLHVKSIVRPERVKSCMDPHTFSSRKNYPRVNEEGRKFSGTFSPYFSGSVLRVNHYTVRDEFYLHNTKIARMRNWIIDVSQWLNGLHALNRESDSTILRFCPQLRQRMGM